MPRYKIICESEEMIIGHLPKSDEWVQYIGMLRIRDGGKTPVTLEMTFDPPHPFALNMPEKQFFFPETSCKIKNYVIW